MIARLTGTIAQRDTDRAVIDVGGVGYEVRLSAAALAALPARGAVTLDIHTHVRETEIALYGFLEATEKAMFLRLQSVAGVGPRLALGMLSGLSPARLAAAIQKRDLALLTRLPGVGRRTAERLVADLADKVEDLAVVSDGDGGVAALGIRGDALSALVHLGYSESAADRALDRVLPAGSDGPAPDLESLLREALRALSRG